MSGRHIHARVAIKPRYPTLIRREVSDVLAFFVHTVAVGTGYTNSNAAAATYYIRLCARTVRPNADVTALPDCNPVFRRGRLRGRACQYPNAVHTKDYISSVPVGKRYEAGPAAQCTHIDKVVVIERGFQSG